MILGSGTPKKSFQLIARRRGLAEGSRISGGCGWGICAVLTVIGKTVFSYGDGLGFAIMALAILGGDRLKRDH